MDFIKKHKLTTLMIIIYIVIIGFGYFLYQLLIGSSGKPVYGDRLDGIENVPISEEQYSEIVSELSNENVVISVAKPVLSGKIFKVIITVGDIATLDQAKPLATKVSSLLTEDQNNFYDVEIYITKEYHCSLKASGKLNEEGNFTEDVIVSFANDLSENKNVTAYGLTDKEQADYNKNQEYKITEDGTYIIYGYTKDKVGESICSLKVVKEASDKEGTSQIIESSVGENFPIIGYKRRATDSFVWSKNR